MGIANDISPKKQKKTHLSGEAPASTVGGSPTEREANSKKNTKVEGENFEININNVPKYADDPFVFDHHEEEAENPDTFRKEAGVPTEGVDKEKNEPENLSEQKEYFGDQGKKKGNPMTKWVVFLIIILVLLLVYQNYSYIEGFFNSEIDSKTEESNESSLYENDYTTETLDTTEENESITDESETNEESTTSSIATDRASLNISVLNGNGISGSAKEVKTMLESVGFSISHVGNALKFSYVNTNIYYNNGKVTEAEDLKNALLNRTCELFENSSVTGNYDMVVVVGMN